MQWLTLVPEDSGVQRLKADNRKPAVTGSVDPVSPYPRVHPTRSGKQIETRSRPAHDRRQGERRRGDERRREQVPVLLDTRCREDRRAIENRRAPATTDEHPPVVRRHINLYA
jgi:hypothetical protein